MSSPAGIAEGHDQLAEAVAQAVLAVPGPGELVTTRAEWFDLWHAELRAKLLAAAALAGGPPQILHAPAGSRGRALG